MFAGACIRALVRNDETPEADVGAILFAEGLMLLRTYMHALAKAGAAKPKRKK